jgi:hypothetical protein
MTFTISGYPKDFANQIGLLQTFGTNNKRIAWLGGHPGSDNSSFEADNSSSISSLPPYDDAANTRHFSFDNDEDEDKDEAQEDPNFQDNINSVANTLSRTCFTADSTMKVIVVVVENTKVREGPAEWRKVVAVNVVLPGGVDIQSVDMKPTDNRKKIRISCYEEKGMSSSKNCIPGGRWMQLNQGLAGQLEAEIQKKLNTEQEHRSTGEAHEKVVDVPNNLQIELVGLQDPYNLFLQDRRTRRDTSLLEAHTYSRMKKQGRDCSSC